MKKFEVLSTQTYEHTKYQIDRISDSNVSKVILKNLSKAPYGICTVITYQNIGETIISPLLSWHNLFFCSGNWGPDPNCEYMNYAVQKGLKTTATAHVIRTQYQDMCLTLPSDCHAVPYESDEENMSMAYVYRDGTLDDLFGFDRVQNVYQLHGITDINWHSIEDAFHKPLSFFANSVNCGFFLEGSCGKENLVLTGLLLGYPIESTIADFKRDYIIFPNNAPREVRDHFRTNDQPVVDANGKKWFKNGRYFFCEGQQEFIYY